MVKPRFTNTRLIRTPHYMYYGQFALSLGKESPYILSKFNPLNTDTFHGPLTVRINGVSLTLYFTLYRYGDYAEVLNILRLHCTT